MKILFLNQHYGLRAPVTGVMLYHLAGRLAARHEVTVIAGRDGDDAAEVGGVRVVRVNALNIGDKSTVRRVLHYASYFLLAAWRGWRLERPDLIVTFSTPPLLAPLLARLLSAAHNAPYHYHVQDLYPDVAAAAGRAPRLLAPLLQTLARRLEGDARGVAVLGERMRAHLRGRSPSEPEVIENFIDTAAVTPLDASRSLRGVWGLERRFVVLYAGNLGVCHDEGQLAGAIELLRDQDIDFVFVVDDAAAERMRRLVGRNPRVQFRPYQPPDKLAAMLATADVGLVSLRRGMSRFVLPCKTYGIMASGRAFVAASDPGDDLYALAQAGCGLWAPAGDAAALARAVLRLRNHPPLAKQLGREGRAHAEARYSLDAAVRRWEAWLTGRDDHTAEEWKSAA